MAPDAEGKMKKLADDVRAEEGRALARLGDGGWDPLVQSGRREGRFADELVEAAAETVRTWRPAVALGRRRSRPCAAATLVPDFAQRLAAALGPPVPRRCSSASAATRRSARWPTPPSRSRTSAASSPSTHGPPPDACLLVDDVRFSGWTLAMVAGQLRRKGAGPVYPLALSTAF